MPYKSEAQRRKFHAMLERGEISARTVREWDKATKGKKLPERVEKKAVEEINMPCGAFERIFFGLPASNDKVVLAQRLHSLTLVSEGKTAAEHANDDVTDEQITAAIQKRASALTVAEQLIFQFAPSDQFAQS